MPAPDTEARQHTFQEVAASKGAPPQHLEMGDLKDVKLSITTELGRRRMLVRDVLELRRGSVIQLDKLAGEMVDLYVNGILMGRGEVVVIGDGLNIRIAEIVGFEHPGESAGEP